MKVTLTPSGEITFDVADSAEAIALARELQGATVSTNSHALKKKSLKPPVTKEKVEEVPLSPALFGAWEALAAGGTDGMHVQSLAAQLKISSGASEQRLLCLMKLGLAHRSGRGLYCPGAA